MVGDVTCAVQKGTANGLLLPNFVGPQLNTIPAFITCKERCWKYGGWKYLAIDFVDGRARGGGQISLEDLKFCSNSAF